MNEKITKSKLFFIKVSINQNWLILGNKSFVTILIRKPKYISIQSFKTISSNKLAFMWTSTTTTKFPHLYRVLLCTLDKNQENNISTITKQS